MRLALGIDVGGTHVVFALLSAAGQFYGRHQIATQAWDGGEALMGRLLGEVSGFLEAAVPSGASVVGIGVGSAGQIDSASGRCLFANENLPGWTGMPIAERLHGATGLPVWVDNDANTAALGEQQFGAAKGLTDVVCITLGTGVGGGVITGARILRGAHGAGGEIGHIPVVPGGAPCACGARGCLEAYASATGIMRQAREAGLAPDSVRALYEMAEQDDSRAKAITEATASYLATGIVAMVAAYDPQAVLIGGGIAQAGALLFDPLNQQLHHHPFVRGRCEIRPCALGDAAGVMGAAAQVFLYA